MSRMVNLSRSVPMKALAVFTAVMAAAAISATAASQAGEPLAVAPSEGSQFTTVAVSGSNCRTGTPSVGGALTGPPGTGSAIEGTPFQTAVVGTVFTVTPDAAGNWTASFTVPPFVPAGQYEVRAICKADPNAATGAEYQPRPFRVLAATAPTISVSPSQARAGQATRFTLSGTLCQGSNARVEARAFLRTPESIGQADEFVARETFLSDASGTWGGVLTLPATLRAGTYGIAAICEVEGRALFTYLPVPEVVLTTAAAPTPAPLRLTG